VGGFGQTNEFGQMGLSIFCHP